MKKADTELKSSIEIRGSFHEDFQEVAETFAENFDKYQEIGSSVCVVVDGETTVDLWAGYKNEQKTDEWEENTLSVAFSSTKAALAQAQFRGRVLADTTPCAPSVEIT